ncbi:MAG: hypothetical protein WD295_03960, partial [Bacteroidota bacterium]
MTFRRLRLVILSLFLLPLLSFSQIVPIVSRVTMREPVLRQPVNFTVELSQNTGVSTVFAYYRTFGASEFREMELQFTGRSASGTFPASIVQPPYFEYYVVVNMVGGRKETHPIQNPDTNPMKVAVKEPDPKDQEVRFLSPEPGETVAVEDLAVAVSLFYASPAVDPGRTQIFLNGVDVTKDLMVAGDLILYSPANFPRTLTPGTHSLRVV